ncbi:MAG: hypothetical protein ABI703_05625 [Gemmatimonadales bacterium]
MPPRHIRWLVAAPLILGAGLSVGGCRGAGRFLGELFRERPPAPLDSMSVASDARIDSSGYLVGSFVGEGTSRAVHLLSSDTGLVAGLVRRYRRDLLQADQPWEPLAREGVVTLGSTGGRRTTGSPRIGRAMVGSPLGQTGVVPRAILLRGGSCGWRGAQVEIIVDHDRRTRGPPLQGPVLGSLTRTDSSAPETNAGFLRREPFRPPGTVLSDELIARTGRVMDSVLALRFPSLVLRGPADSRIETNTLADVDAADVMAFRSAPGRVRFAVSLRERRITAGNDTLLAATVMAWDSAGAWQQTVFRPTLLSYRRGRLAPYGALRRSIFWRRLQAISDFGFERDNLWMEQIDVAEGSVIWGIIQPAGNVVVAAAQMEAPCQ